MWSGLAEVGGVADHAALTNLAYADAGHTGFEVSGAGAAAAVAHALELASTTPGFEGATLVGHHIGHSVFETFQHLLNRGVLTVPAVVGTGGLNISWTACEIYDYTTQLPVSVSAGSGVCTDGAVNYLVLVSGTTLTLRLTQAEDNETNVATIHCQSGAIIDIHVDNILATIVSALKRGARNVIPLVVTSGLIVSEDADATNVWDVVCSFGKFYLYGTQEYILAAPVYSRVVPMVRWFHTAGVWTSDTNAQIDSTQYDNGTNLAAVTANKYYKSLFLIVDGVIHWVYPQAEFATEAQAIASALPTIPPGLAAHPQVTAVVLRGNAAVFPVAGTDAWIDVRPRICGAISGPITDHGALAGLLDDDHPQYASALPSKPQTLTDGANIAWDLALGGAAQVTLGGNRTLSNPTNMVVGALYSLRVIQDGSGNRALTFGSVYLWPRAIPLTLTKNIGATDVLAFLCDGISMIPLAAVFDVRAT